MHRSIVAVSCLAISLFATSAFAQTSCPTGMVLRQAVGGARCECSGETHWDGSTRRCVPNACAGGTVWDASTQSCRCAADQLWDAQSHACVASPCSGGTVYDSTTQSCGCPDATPRWDRTERRCEACPTGTIPSGHDCLDVAELARAASAAALASAAELSLTPPQRCERCQQSRCTDLITSCNAGALPACHAAAACLCKCDLDAGGCGVAESELRACITRHGGGA